MKQKVSELLDGELADEHLNGTLAHLQDNPEALETWAAYQVIGDALRGDLAPGSRIATRVHAALSSEPTVLAPAAIPRPSRLHPSRLGVRIGLAVAAAIVSLSMVAFVARQQGGETSAAPGQLASDHDYLRAHQLLIPDSTARGPAAPGDTGFRFAGYPMDSAAQDGNK